MRRAPVENLPTGWAATPLKYLATSSGGLTPSKDKPQYWNGDVPWVTPKDMKRPLLSDSQDHVSSLALVETGLKLHAPDGVMVVTRGMILAHTFPVARNAVPVTVNQDMKVLRAGPSTDARYLAWLLQGLSPVMLSLTDESAHGTKALRTDQWENLPVPMPKDRSVQECIANFLDEQTARIDALIAEKNALLQLLPELQSQAVDETVLGREFASDGSSLKGVDQLGRIPSHWTSSRLKYELEYVTSGSRGWADYYGDEGALFVRIGNLTRNSVDLDLTDIQRVALPEAAEGTRARVKEGDLLISITAYLGSVAVAPQGLEEAYVSQHVALARPTGRRAHPRWLAYVLLSSVGRTFFDLQAYGGTKVQLSLDDIREVPVPLPALEDQRMRVEKLELRLRRIQDTASHVTQHIVRLREYRSSLISAAVTGELNLGDSKSWSEERLAA